MDYHKDSWSLALSYDPETCITTGFFCADKWAQKEHTQPREIIRYLIESKQHSIHPMLLPSIMFRKLLDSSVKHRDKLRIKIQSLEDQIGVTPGRKKKEQEKADARLDKKGLSRDLNSCKKDQASRDGRHQFWRQFKNVLMESMDEIQKSTTEPHRDLYIQKTHHELKHLTSFNVKIFSSLDGRDINYSERIEAQLKLVITHFHRFDRWYQLITLLAIQSNRSRREQISI